MANNYWRGTTNSNWGTATNWSLGAVPTSNDGNVAVFDGSSPNCTLNINALCNNVDFTLYTNTITLTNNLNVSGNCTLGSSMIITYSAGLLVLNGTGTLTPNTKQWIGQVNITGNITLTLAANFYCNLLVIGTTTNTLTLTNNTIYCQSLNSTLTSGTCSGTTQIVLNGLGVNISSTGISNTISTSTPTNNTWTGGNWNTAGNWSQGAVPTANDGFLTVVNGVTGTVNAVGNCNALKVNGGTVTMSNAINVYGSVALGASTPTLSGTGQIISARTGSISSLGGVWSNSYQLTTASSIYILTSNFTILGTLSWGATTITLNKTSTEYFGCGGLTLGAYAPTKGTATIRVNSGTITANGGNGNNINNPIELNGNISFGTGINLTENAPLIYTSGTITTTGSTVIYTFGSNTNLNLCSAFNYNNLYLSIPTSSNITISSDLTVNGTLTLGNPGGTPNSTITGTYNITCGTLFANTGFSEATFNFTATFIVNGLSTLTSAGSSNTYNGGNFICKGGLSVFAGSVLGTATIEVQGGTISCTTGIINNQVNLNGSTTFGNTVRFAKLAWVSGTLTVTNSTLYIQVTSNIDMQGQTLYNVTVMNTTLNLLSELKIQGALTGTASTAASHGLIKSNSSGVQRKLTLLSAATYDLSFVDFTDIDANDGKPIWSYKGTISNSNNVFSLTPNSFNESLITVN